MNSKPIKSVLKKLLCCFLALTLCLPYTLSKTEIANADELFSSAETAESNLNTINPINMLASIPNVIASYIAVQSSQEGEYVTSYPSVNQIVSDTESNWEKEANAVHNEIEKYIKDSANNPNYDKEKAKQLLNKVQRLCDNTYSGVDINDVRALRDLNEKDAETYFRCNIQEQAQNVIGIDSNGNATSKGNNLVSSVFALQKAYAASNNNNNNNNDDDPWPVSGEDLRRLFDESDTLNDFTGDHGVNLKEQYNQVQEAQKGIDNLVSNYSDSKSNEALAQQEKFSSDMENYFTVMQNDLIDLKKYNEDQEYEKAQAAAKAAKDKAAEKAKKKKEKMQKQALEAIEYALPYVQKCCDKLDKTGTLSATLNWGKNMFSAYISGDPVKAIIGCIEFGKTLFNLFKKKKEDPWKETKLPAAKTYKISDIKIDNNQIYNEITDMEYDLAINFNTVIRHLETLSSEFNVTPFNNAVRALSRLNAEKKSSLYGIALEGSQNADGTSNYNKNAWHYLDLTDYDYKYNEDDFNKLKTIVRFGDGGPNYEGKTGDAATRYSYFNIAQTLEFLAEYSIEDEIQDILNGAELMKNGEYKDINKVKNDIRSAVEDRRTFYKYANGCLFGGKVDTNGSVNEQTEYYKAIANVANYLYGDGSVLKDLKKIALSKVQENGKPAVISDNTNFGLAYPSSDSVFADLLSTLNNVGSQITMAQSYIQTGMNAMQMDLELEKFAYSTYFIPSDPNSGYIAIPTEWEKLNVNSAINDLSQSNGGKKARVGQLFLDFDIQKDAILKDIMENHYKAEIRIDGGDVKRMTSFTDAWVAANHVAMKGSSAELKLIDDWNYAHDGTFKGDQINELKSTDNASKYFCDVNNAGDENGGLFVQGATGEAKTSSGKLTFIPGNHLIWDVTNKIPEITYQPLVQFVIKDSSIKSVATAKNSLESGAEGFVSESKNVGLTLDNVDFDGESRDKFAGHPAIKIAISELRVNNCSIHDYKFENNYTDDKIAENNNGIKGDDLERKKWALRQGQDPSAVMIGFRDTWGIATGAEGLKGIVKEDTYKCAATFVDCKFNNCKSNYYGGAVKAGFIKNAFEFCNFNNCSAGSGGAICYLPFKYQFNSANNWFKPVISACNFTSNSATDGGAIYSNLGTICIAGSSFEGNKASQNGGAICCDTFSPWGNNVSGSKPWEVSGNMGDVKYDYTLGCGTNDMGVKWGYWELDNWMVQENLLSYYEPEHCSSSNQGNDNTRKTVNNFTSNSEGNPIYGYADLTHDSSKHITWWPSYCKPGQDKYSCHVLGECIMYENDYWRWDWCSYFNAYWLGHKDKWIDAKQEIEHYKKADRNDYNGFWLSWDRRDGSRAPYKENLSRRKMSTTYISQNIAGTGAAVYYKNIWHAHLGHVDITNNTCLYPISSAAAVDMSNYVTSLNLYGKVNVQRNHNLTGRDIVLNDGVNVHTTMMGYKQTKLNWWNRRAGDEVYQDDMRGTGVSIALAWGNWANDKDRYNYHKATYQVYERPLDPESSIGFIGYSNGQPWNRVIKSYKEDDSIFENIGVGDYNKVFADL